MAKLNGVTVVSEKITYNGAEYVKTDADAKVGDIIREDRGYSFMPKGDFYEVVDRNGSPVVYDEDGDYFNANSGQVTVFAKVEAAATADIVVHNGVTYRKFARKAKDGDKYVVANVNETDLRKGVVYAIDNVDSAGYVNVIDDAEDEHYLCDNEFTVLEPLASAPSTPVTAKLPSTLSQEDYVIHEGAVYRKESRKAEVGEKVVALRNSVDVYDSGHIGVYTGDGFVNFSGQGNSYVCKDGKWACSHPNYAVLVPTDTVTVGGAEYTLEKRKANVGDTVLVVANTANAGMHGYRIGALTPIESEWGRGTTHVKGNGEQSPYLAVEDYFVLVPKTAANPAPIYTEVKRKANVGERIRIVDAVGAGGKYANGDEGTVTYTNSAGVFFDANGGNYGAYHSEYVVLEDAEPTKPDRLKVGDYAKVVQSGHSNEGKIVKVTEDNRNSHYVYRTALLNGDSADVHAEYQLVRATDAEVAAAKRKNVKVGDYVRITGNKAPNDGGPHHYEIGDIVEVTCIYSDSVSCVRKSDNRSQTVSAINYEPVTAAEAEAARKQAEEAAAKAAETAKWSAIGRKVGEFKAGDIVKIRDNWPAAGVVDGEISTIKTVDYSDCGVYFTKNNPQGYPAWVASEFITLVAPVESLFN